MRRRANPGSTVPVSHGNDDGTGSRRDRGVSRFVHCPPTGSAVRGKGRTTGLVTRVGEGGVGTRMNTGGLSHTPLLSPTRTVCVRRAHDGIRATDDRGAREPDHTPWYSSLPPPPMSGEGSGGSHKRQRTPGPKGTKSPRSLLSPGGDSGRNDSLRVYTVGTQVPFLVLHRRKGSRVRGPEIPKVYETNFLFLLRKKGLGRHPGRDRVRERLPKGEGVVLSSWVKCLFLRLQVTWWGVRGRLDSWKGPMTGPTMSLSGPFLRYYCRQENHVCDHTGSTLRTASATTSLYLWSRQSDHNRDRGSG